MSEDIMNPFVPEETQQDKVAKFEDLTPAAKLDQLNAVKDQFIADNTDDTARGFIEVTDVSFVRQDDGKELYIVTVKEIDKENNTERTRNEFYTIDSQTADLVNVRQYSQQEIEQQNAIDHDLAGKMAARQQQLDDAAKSEDKISMTDLEKAERAGEELGIPKEEVDEANSYEIVNDGVKFSADKLPSGTDSKPIKGNQLLDDNTTLNNLIGKNFQYYKFIKSTSGQKMVIGINADGSFEPIDSDTLEVLNVPTMNLIAEKGQKVQDPVSVTFAFRVRQYPTRAFGVYNRGAEYGSFYAEGANQDGHMLGVKIDNVEPNNIYPNTREIFQKDDVHFEEIRVNAENKHNDDKDEILNSVNGVAPEVMPVSEINKLRDETNLATDNWNQIVKETEEACAKDPNKDFKKLLAEKATTAAYELDTITGDKANELAEEYGIQDVAPNDHEPDEPELGANPYNHYN